MSFYQCGFCGEFFSSQEAVEKHISENHPPKPMSNALAAENAALKAVPEDVAEAVACIERVMLAAGDVVLEDSKQALMAEWLNQNAPLWPDAFDTILAALNTRDEELRALREPALVSVLAERQRQDSKWGEQNHHVADWCLILGEEYGELCQAVLEGAVFDNGRREEFTPAEIRAEAVQCAAVALSMVQSIDRATRTATCPRPEESE